MDDSSVDGSRLLPVFLKVAGRRVLVVGGGAVAATKVRDLVEAGARVTVIAPVVSPAIRRMAVAVERRPVRARDLDRAWLVVSAAPPAVNRRVERAARARRVWVNAVDDPRHATAYLGSVLRRDGLTIAVSTAGRAPALSALVREGLERLLPADLPRWFARADRLRRDWRRRQDPMSSRRPQLATAIAALYPRPDDPARRGPG